MMRERGTNLKGSVIGLLCAVDAECRNLMKKLERSETLPAGNIQFIKGRLEGSTVVLARTGIGKTNAAHGATLLAERFHPACLIGFGIGGAYPGTGYGIGDVLVAEKEYYADEGVQNVKGTGNLKETGIPLFRKGRKTYYNELPADQKLLKTFRSIADKLPFRFGYGNFLTVSAVTGTMKRARALRDAFHGICENMEGAALFHIAHMYGVPCLEIRGVSNMAEKRDKRKWNIPAASGAVQHALAVFLRAL